MLLNTLANPDHRYWQDYLPFLQQFTRPGFPDCEQLNSLLPTGLHTAGGSPIRFVNSSELDDDAYEQRIFTSGQISTRPNNWHDLFNALVWMRFPQIKIALNTLHSQGWSESSDGNRGRLRDALTLFDECGVIVFATETTVLRRLSQRQWTAAFQELRTHWGVDIRLSICGHAMLEKYLTPYKSMTAKALLVQVDEETMRLDKEAQLKVLDQNIAEQLLAGKMLMSPACLSPLPLAGVPDWWPFDEQNDSFYTDTQVFRSTSAELVPAPLYHLS
jgi:hypothetical protein